MKRRWTALGILIAITGFFAHPEQCVSAGEVIQHLPENVQSAITHGATLLGLALASIGPSVMRGKDEL